MKILRVAAAVLLAAGAANAQDPNRLEKNNAAEGSKPDFGHGMPWDDDAANSGQVFPRGNVEVGAMRIRTSRPDCLVSAGFPVLRALIDPVEAVSGASLRFRPEGYPLWYAVPMQRVGPGFVAVLPRPRPSAQRVRYFVEVTPFSGTPRRGNELAARVVEAVAQCPGVVAEASETAAIGVRVPKGAPAQPPVPPGFEPVGTASLNPPTPRGHKAPLLVAGGFAGAVGALFASSNATVAVGTPAPSEITFLDSTPPPDSHLSLASGPQLTVRLRVRMDGAGVGAGRATFRVSLLRSDAGDAPCAVMEAPLTDGLSGSREVAVSGPLAQARVCQPSDHLRLELVQDGIVLVGSRPDVQARYFIDP